jgi:hypothetical protein
LKTQTKIDLEQDANLILGTLLRYGKELIWTRQIILDVFHLPKYRAIAALNRLEDNGYLSYLGGQYKTTTYGEEYYDGVSKKYHLEISNHAWKTEVLTGMDAAGDETSIDRAAIPGPSTIPVEHFTPERAAEEHERLIKWKNITCKRLGIDDEEYHRRVVDHSLKYCRGEDKLFPHLGIFDRKGKGWQHLCRACRKKLRKRKRSKQ